MTLEISIDLDHKPTVDDLPNIINVHLKNQLVARGFVDTDGSVLKPFEIERTLEERDYGYRLTYTFTETIYKLN